MNKKIYIGTSGWQYKHWRHTFYPDHIKIKDHFAYYKSLFDTVEMNNPFYGVPKKETYEKWHLQVDDHFIYSIKVNRMITHLKKLNGAGDYAHAFINDAALLKENLGPFLLQLPPKIHPDPVVLDNFIAELPKGFKYAFEFRNKNWLKDEFYEVLKKHNAAFVIYEFDYYRTEDIVTADFVYVRLHGPEGKYSGIYSDEALAAWAEKIKKWNKDKEVFFYFDNDSNGYAPHNALKLKEYCFIS